MSPSVDAVASGSSPAASAAAAAAVAAAASSVWEGRLSDAKKIKDAKIISPFLRSQFKEMVLLQLHGENRAQDDDELRDSKETKASLMQLICDMSDEERGKYFKLAMDWVDTNKQDADRKADAFSQMAVIGALVFGFAVNSVLITSSDWYEEEIQQGTERDKRLAISYYYIMALSCVFSAWGLSSAVLRCWILKLRCVTDPTGLETFMTSEGAGYAAQWVNILVWGAIGLYLIGLALFAASANEGRFTSGLVAIFSLGAFGSLLIIGYILFAAAGFYFGRKKEPEEPVEPEPAGAEERVDFDEFAFGAKSWFNASKKYVTPVLSVLGFVSALFGVLGVFGYFNPPAPETLRPTVLPTLPPTPTSMSTLPPT